MCTEVEAPVDARAVTAGPIPLAAVVTVDPGGSRITTMGRKVIVAVTMQAENPDGTNVQQVLVGTPQT